MNVSLVLVKTRKRWESSRTEATRRGLTGESLKDFCMFFLMVAEQETERAENKTRFRPLRADVYLDVECVDLEPAVSDETASVEANGSAGASNGMQAKKKEDFRKNCSGGSSAFLFGNMHSIFSAALYNISIVAGAIHRQ